MRSPSRAGGGGPALVGAVIMIAVVATAGWWLARRAETRRVDAELASLGALALPAQDAPVDARLAALGSTLFERRCAACHAITGDSRIGPDLAGVTRRRELPWIRSMMLRPDSMVENDPVARALKAQYEVRMLVSGGLTDAQALALVEFLRRVDSPGS